MTILISIQGNIGSGKSSLLKTLYDKHNKNLFFINNKKIGFLQEPVGEWEHIKDENNISLLELYYNDQKTYSFAFQIMAFMSRLKQLKEALSKDYDVIISERSLSADHEIFTKMLLEDNSFKKIEYKLYLKWVNEFLVDMPKEYIVYLKTTPEIAYERIKNRNRQGENISFNYVKKCHNYHEKWINDLQFCLLNGNLNLNSKDNDKIIDLWLLKIKDYISNICNSNDTKSHCSISC